MNWRPRGFRLGKMREFIDFQAPTETVSSTGTGEPIVTWSNFATNIPAAYEETGGVEFMRGRQLESNTKAIFIVRFRTDLTTTMRIVHNSNYYGITAINAVDGGRRYLEIMATTVN